MTVVLIVCLVTGAGLLALRERPCPLAIYFIYFTNDSTEAYGVFAVTNRSDTALKFRGITESKENGSWPRYSVGTVLPHYPVGIALQDTGPHPIAAHQSCEVRARVRTDGVPDSRFGSRDIG